MLKKLHLGIGLLMMLVFLFTGQYLKMTLPPFAGEFDAQRMMYRASHVYLMMSAAVNLMTGIYFRPFSAALAKRLQLVASTLIVLAPMILLLAFIVEPAQQMTQRSFTLIGALSLFSGVVLAILAAATDYFQQQKITRSQPD